MNAAHVRRGGKGGAKKRAAPKRKRGAAATAEYQAGRWAGLAFAAFMVAIAVVAAIALDIPAKAQQAAGTAVGRAGFVVRGYQIVGLSHMDRRIVDQIVTDELNRAAESASLEKAPQPFVDVRAIRDRLLRFGWVQDARIARRLPDTLTIDIVERRPAAVWQDDKRLSLIDSKGVVIDQVPIAKMPDLPLLVGRRANLHNEELALLMSTVPTLKPQLASARWVGDRRWDLNFQSGETVALPEGRQAARTSLAKFARLDRTDGLLGRGVQRFDLRIPGKMIVRLRTLPGETATGPAQHAG